MKQCKGIRAKYFMLRTAFTEVLTYNVKPSVTHLALYDICFFFGVCFHFPNNLNGFLGLKKMHIKQAFCLVGNIVISPSAELIIS